VIAPDRLAEALRLASIAVERDGPLTWDRVQDWTLPGRMPSRGERGGGLVDAEDDQRIDDRREDAAAARYKPELEALTRRIDADVARLQRIIAICNPDPPTTLRDKDRLRSQLEADGWCGSCHRNDQTCVPIALRPAKAPAPSAPYYKGLCRFCGSFKASHGVLPPVVILRLHHKARPITETDVERALGKVSA
jgi:hypothetical protein